MKKRLFILTITLCSILLLLGGCIKKENQITQDSCNEDKECIPDACCHASGCISEKYAPDCSRKYCTMNCAPDTLDCGQKKCGCVNKKCKVI